MAGFNYSMKIGNNFRNALSDITGTDTYPIPAQKPRNTHRTARHRTSQATRSCIALAAMQ